MKTGLILGVGRHRVVWEDPDNPDCVIKVSHRHQDGSQNRNEWRLWHESPGHIKHHLAPCVWISDCGHYLKQRRGEPADRRPDSYPAELVDAKPANWVIIDGRMVMCDYGHGEILRVVLGC
jgi:hypothetical protein